MLDRAILRYEIGRMVDLVEEKIDSPENRRRQELWEATAYALYGRPRAGGKIPITVTPEIQMWARLHRIRLVDFYQVPELWVYGQLKAKLFAFDEFRDDRPLDRDMWMWLGTAFESSLVGRLSVLCEELEPEKGQIPYTRCREALDHLEQPDFHKSGLMPLAHRMYEQCRALLPASYGVDFPDFIAMPMETASDMVGLETLLSEVAEGSEAAHALLRRCGEVRLQFRKDRARFLGTDLAPGFFGDDFVCVPIISPGFFREVVWPIERELAEEEGGIIYWHSCGNTTPMLESVQELSEIDLLHISAWTDRRAAGRMVREAQPLQVCVHPIREVLEATDAEIERSLSEIIEHLGRYPIKIDADGLEACMDMPEEIARVKHWIELAQRITAEAA